MGEAGDAGGEFVFYQHLETASIVESGKFFHHTPDEGQTFTYYYVKASNQRVIRTTISTLVSHDFFAIQTSLLF